jgi:hypothetical protein
VSDGSSGEVPRFGPFGFNGSYVGQCAIEVLAGLSEPIADIEDSDRKLVVWSQDDGRVFSDLYELEGGIRLIDPTDIDGDELAGLYHALGRFHTALPLSEAERYWIFDPLDSRPSRRAWNIWQPETLADVTETVTSGGLKQVIHGREVVRRLTAWRRETDEFAGQGTLDEAREALGEIALTLVSEKSWPRERKDLRASLLAQ